MPGVPGQTPDYTTPGRRMGIRIRGCNGVVWLMQIPGRKGVNSEIGLVVLTLETCYCPYVGSALSLERDQHVAQKGECGWSPSKRSQTHDGGDLRARDGNREVRE